MSERFTLERILRDDDDASGQSVREWALTIDGSSLAIRGRSEGHVLHVRLADIDQLKRDLDRCLAVYYAGDTIVSASDTTPTPASAAKGEAVAWRFKYPDDGRWHYSAIEPVRIAETVQPLYAQPHPSQQAGTEGLWIERELLDKAAYALSGTVLGPQLFAALNPSEARGQ